MPKCERCGESFANRVTVDGEIRNFQRRRYCLKCVPFDSRRKSPAVAVGESLFDPSLAEKKCARCDQILPISDFYGRRNGQGITVYCKRCVNRQTVERQQKFKRECVAYKGGKCDRCGYSRCIAALEFHHVDPSKKEFEISVYVRRNGQFDDALRRELDQCRMVCANCHREEHFLGRGGVLL